MGQFSVQLNTPSSVPPKKALLFANPESQAKKSENYLKFRKWLRKTSFNIQEAIDHPSDALYGAAKGIANIPAQPAEAFLKGLAEQQAAELREAASMQASLGRKDIAQDMDDIAKASKIRGTKIDLPKFIFINSAEQGGDTIATAAQLFSGGLGALKIATGGVLKGIRVTKNIARASEELSVPLIEVAAPVEKMIGPAGDGVHIVSKVNVASSSNYRSIVDAIPGKILNEADALNPAR